MKAVVLALAMLVALPAMAVEPNEVLDNPVLESRARAISRHLRCLVCQNQSIDDSNADLARDLRVLLRERLVAGDSDADAVNFIVARYGDFVLLKPPVKPTTYVLWFGPAAIAVLALAGAVVYFRRRRSASAAAAPLTDAERRRLADLLDDEDRP